MANWSNPTLSSTYTNFLSELKARDEDLAKQFDGTTSSNLATGTIRWNSTTNRWQKWSGSAWAELTGTYALTALTTTGNASIGGTLAVTGATTLAAATATTPATGNNSTAVATTAYVRAQAYAPLASPTLTGTPAAPTAAVGTNTTQLATTAFVNGEIANDAPTKTGGGASGTWGISVTGNAATVTTNANLTGDITSIGNATSIAAGVIVNADINASAAIADTKLATISTAGKVSGTAITSGKITTNGNLEITNGAPTIQLTESGGTATHSQSFLARDNDTFQHQTRNSTGTIVSSDYLIPANASGATDHIWRIANTERMRIDSDGNVKISGKVGIGDLADATLLRITGDIPDDSQGFAIGVTVKATASTSTSNIFGYISDIEPTTTSANTVSALYRYNARQLNSFGSATVTNQYGFIAETNLTGATNNFGFHSGLNDATGRWNFYAAGTAPNYFAGDVHIANTGVNITSGSSNGFSFFSGGSVVFARAGNVPLFIGRNTDDGTLVAFYQAGTFEGNISVAGSTISYNPFLGSHWGRLDDGSKPDILPGTILDTVDQLIEWKQAKFTVDGEEKIAAYNGAAGVGDSVAIDYEGTSYSAIVQNEEEEPEELNKHVCVKVNDTASSKAVFGVFLGWDHDIPDGMVSTWNDLYCAAVGNYFVRIADGETLEIGSLIEADGNGCGIVQDDDIIRSNTVAKITSTIPQKVYDDGSFLVTCVLCCG